MQGDVSDKPVRRRRTAAAPETSPEPAAAAAPPEPAKRPATRRQTPPALTRAEAVEIAREALAKVASTRQSPKKAVGEAIPTEPATVKPARSRPHTAIKPAVAVPQTTKPVAALPPVAKPKTALPPAAKAKAALPPAAKPKGALPPAAKPKGALLPAKPVATTPEATRAVAAPPKATKPAAAKPVVTKPVAAKPAVTKPVAAKPAATKPVAAKPPAKLEPETPPAAKPVVARPRATRSLTALSPATRPVAGSPPGIEPPATSPPSAKSVAASPATEIGAPSRRSRTTRANAPEAVEAAPAEAPTAPARSSRHAQPAAPPPTELESGSVSAPARSTVRGRSTRPPIRAIAESPPVSETRGDPAVQQGGDSAVGRPSRGRGRTPAEGIPVEGATPGTTPGITSGDALGVAPERDRWGRGRRGRGRGRFAEGGPHAGAGPEAVGGQQAPLEGAATGPDGQEAGGTDSDLDYRRRRRGGRRRGRGRLDPGQVLPGEAGVVTPDRGEGPQDQEPEGEGSEAEGQTGEGGEGGLDAYGRRGRRHRRRGRRRGQPLPLTSEEQTTLEAKRVADAAAKEERRRLAEQQRVEAQRRKAEREVARRAQQQASQSKREATRRPKRGPAFGETWWSARWTAVLETFGWAARVARGAEYARLGMVRDLYMDEYGVITARVQGSRPEPYTVELSMVHLTQEQWDAVLHEMSQNALLAAQLLAGDMPQDIEEVFFNVGVTLFPYDGQEIYADCDCPDQVNPCKHIAAVFYTLAQEFDRDPFLIFRFRGRDGEQVAAYLRALRAEAGIEEVEEPALLEPEILPLAECLDSFWKGGEVLDTLRLQIAPPVTPGAVLLRLGQPNGWDGARGFIFTMAPYFQALSERALQAAYAESGEVRPGTLAPHAAEAAEAAEASPAAVGDGSTEATVIPAAEQTEAS